MVEILQLLSTRFCLATLNCNPWIFLLFIWLIRFLQLSFLDCLALEEVICCHYSVSLGFLTPVDCRRALNVAGVP